MKPPEIANDSFTSDLCLIIDDKGNRHVGYYHMNNRWYIVAKHGSSVTDNIIVSWELLNKKQE